MIEIYRYVTTFLNCIGYRIKRMELAVLKKEALDDNIVGRTNIRGSSIATFCPLKAYIF